MWLCCNVAQCGCVVAARPSAPGRHHQGEDLTALSHGGKYLLGAVSTLLGGVSTMLWAVSTLLGAVSTRAE